MNPNSGPRLVSDQAIRQMTGEPISRLVVVLAILAGCLVIDVLVIYGVFRLAQWMGR